MSLLLPQTAVIGWSTVNVGSFPQTKRHGLSQLVLKQLPASARIEYFSENTGQTYINYHRIVNCMHSRVDRDQLQTPMKLGDFCGLANGLLTMAFPVVIDIHQACCSEFAVTVMPAIYINLASHWSPCGLHRNMYPAGTFLLGWWVPS